MKRPSRNWPNRDSVVKGEIEPSDIIQPLADASLSGFGNTIIQVEKILPLHTQAAIKFLDAIYTIVEQTKSW